MTTASGNPLVLDRGLRQFLAWAGIGALVAAIAYLIAVSLIFVSTPPAAGGAATLEYIGANRELYIIKQLLWLAPSLLAVFVFLALYYLLTPVSRYLAGAGGFIGAVGWALSLSWLTSGEGAPALVVLADRYAQADAAYREALAAAAEVLVAVNATPALPGVAQTLGILLISLAMLRSPLSRTVTYLGIATGMIGLVGEALRPLLGAGYALAGLLMIAWFFAIGWQLLVLSLKTGAASAPAAQARVAG